MDKLKLAHDWAIKNGSELIYKTAEEAWQYADAMQAEAEKRNKAEAAQKRKEIREMLNAPNTFVEREGQHFDDVEEWQPDWSQAPDDANMITIDACGVGQYWVMYQGNEPKLGENRWFDDYRGRYLGGFEPVGFNGNWKNSLRKRPQ